MTSYTFTVLDDPSATGGTFAQGINDSDEIVGYYVTSGSYENPFIYTDGSYAPVQTNNYGASTTWMAATTAEGINDQGEIVGGGSYVVYSAPWPSQNYAVEVEFVGPYDGYTTTISGSPWSNIQAGLDGYGYNYLNTYACGVNTQGVVVGYYTDHDTTEGFIEGDGIQDLKYSGATATYAHGVNDEDQVVGYWIGTDKDFPGVDTAHGFFYNNGAWSYFDDPNGVNGTFAEGINNSDVIVGYYVDGNGFTHGFIFNKSAGTYTTYNAPGAVNTYLYGINNAGEMVGVYTDSEGETHSFTLLINQFTFARTATGGIWNLAANWSPEGIPSAGSTALLTKPGTYTVNSTQDNTVAVLAMEAGATLALGAGSIFQATSGTGSLINAGKIVVSPNATLELGGRFANAGSILLSAGGVNARLEIVGSALTLADGGKVTLSDDNANAIVTGGSAATLTNVNDKIAGAGTIGDTYMSLLNEAGGVIDGDGVANQLTVGAVNVTNLGTLEGTTSQGLVVFTVDNEKTIEAVGKSATVTLGMGIVSNANAGLILASGAGAEILLGGGGPTILGGKLQTVGSGAAIVTLADGGGATLSGATVVAGSLVEVTDGNLLQVEGSSFDNAGLIRVAGSSDATGFLIDNTLVLKGSGTIDLVDAGNETTILDDNGFVATLTNANDKIIGGGVIGDANMTLVNSAGGVVAGNSTSAALVLDATTSNFGLVEGTTSQGLTIDGAITNAKTIVASGKGAAVEIASTVTQTAAGLIEAAGTGALVELEGATIVSGKLATVGPRAAIEVTADSAAALNGVAITASSLVEAASGATLSLAGASIGAGATVETLAGGTVLVSGTVVDAGTLFASGSGSLIDITGGATVNGGVAKIDDGIVDIAATSSKESVTFVTSGSGGLIVDDMSGDLAAYAGKVTGFGGVHNSNTAQFIDLTDVAYSAGVVSATYSANAANTGGVLTVTSGGTAVAEIDLVGNYKSAHFDVAAYSGSVGATGSVEITDPAATIAGGAITALASAAASDPSPINTTGASNVALLGSYMASMFASAEGGVTPAGHEAPQNKVFIASPHAG